MSDNDTKDLSNYDTALELLNAERAYNQERLEDKRISVAKTKYLTLNLARIDRDINSVEERRKVVQSRVAWEQRIATNFATSQRS
jgi:hypothetical protein